MKKDDFDEKIAQLEEALGYNFQNTALLKTAMVHRSYYNEHKDEVPGYNERLEFIGDAVLGLCVTHQLYTKFPNLQEGELTQIRSQVVDANACQAFAKALEITDCIFVGKGEQFNTGRGKEKVIGNFFEALIGAIFLDGGLEAAEKTFGSLFNFQIKKEQSAPSKNWKSQLQDFAQKEYQQTPLYKTLETHGPEHAKLFHVAVFLGDDKIAEGRGPSKKEAQFEAAKLGLKSLKEKKL